MDADAFSKVLYIILDHHKVTSGRLSALSSNIKIFSYPFHNQPPFLGVKAMVYTGIASGRKRVGKMAWDHATNCVVSGLGAPTAGLGAAGSGVATFAGKFGGIKPAFGVNMGAVGASHAIHKAKQMADPTAAAAQMASAIIASNHLMQFIVGRIDTLGAVGPQRIYDLWLVSVSRPDGYTNTIESMIKQGQKPGGMTRYRVRMDGSVSLYGRQIGNVRHRRWF